MKLLKQKDEKIGFTKSFTKKVALLSEEIS